MRLSHIFIPWLRHVPQDITTPSHRLMLRTGMIYPVASGIFAWWPLGLKVLRTIEHSVRTILGHHGIHEVLMPTMQPAHLWEQSDRFNDYGQEMLKIQDRRDHTLVYGPTAEEVITSMAKDFLHSYRQLPQCFYNIQWKFRDEIRPRFGVMRGREFLMKDAYSFDLTPEDGEKTYARMMNIYKKIFTALGVKAIPVQADNGPIGGTLSHEFHMISQTGENVLHYDKRWETQEGPFYASTQEKHTPTAQSDAHIIQARGIEIAHLFLFGTKYSDALNGQYTPAQGTEKKSYVMGSYGIGISRLVGAIIEANHDDHGIIWPVALAPYKVAIVPIHTECDTWAETLYQTLQQDTHLEPLWDDRPLRPGEKFSTLDLLGIPFQVRLSKTLQAKNLCEIKVRATHQTLECPISDVQSTLHTLYASLNTSAPI